MGEYSSGPDLAASSRFRVILDPTQCSFQWESLAGISKNVGPEELLSGETGSSAGTVKETELKDFRAVAGAGAAACTNKNYSG